MGGGGGVRQGGVVEVVVTWAITMWVEACNGNGYIFVLVVLVMGGVYTPPMSPDEICVLDIPIPLD